METSAPCPPINTARLKPTKQRLNRIFLTITESGHVMMELMSHMTSQSGHQTEVTKECLRVSPDGMQIEVYHGAEGMPTIDVCHVSPQPNQIYRYPDLPGRLWKKYQHAHKFVEVVKSRSAKVVMITNRARCKLMENCPHPDFEACFPSGVTLMFSKLKVTLTDPDGCNLTFNEDLASSHVSPGTMALLEYSLQCRDQCLRIEKSVSDLQTRDSTQIFFPITVGTNSHPYLLSDQQMVNPSRPDQVIGQVSIEAAHLSPEMWEAMSENRNILLPQDNAYSEAASYKQLTCPQQSHDYQQTMNVFQDNSSECQSRNTPVYEHSSELCAENILREPCKTISHRISPSELDVCNFAEAETQKQRLESCTQFEDSDTSRSTFSSLASYSVSSTPQKSNNNSSHYPQPSNSEPHLLCQCTDMTGHSLPTQIVYCDDRGQFNEQQDLLGHNMDAGLVNTFQSECNLPQNFDVANSFSACSCEPHIETQELEQPKQFLMCQSNVCDSIDSRKNLATCSKHLPEFTASQFQNDFSTPQKSSIPFDFNFLSSSGNLMKYRRNKGSRAYDLSLDDELNETRLQNIQRNLFADQISKEPLSSLLSTSQTIVSTSNLLQLSNCSRSEDSTSVNMPQVDITYVNHRAGPQSHLDHVSIQPSLLMDDVLSATSKQSSPVKAPTVVKSVVRCSEVSDIPVKNQTETLFSVARLLHSSNPSEPNSGDDHFYENYVINKPGSNSSYPDFVRSFPQQQTLGSVPEVSASPRKSAPIRKISCLSPHKMSSKMLGEANIQTNLTLEHTDMIPSDYFLRGQLTNPVKFSRCNSGSSSSSANSTANHHFTQSRETLINSRIDPSTLRKTTCPTSLAVPSCKDFRTTSPASVNWSGRDLLLSPHFRNSLDVSSDGLSSPPSSVSDVISQVFVPYTGWASFYATGTVWILYNDGTQLGVKSTEAAMIYIDQDGSQTRYTDSVVVPEIVKLKLEKLPKVIEMLMKSQATNSPGSLL